MKTIRISLLLLCAALFSGCASMSAEECALSDWRAVGYEDGSRGATADQFANRRKACAKHGVAANFDAYDEGRREGLVEYCQPSRGFNVGAAGGRYNGVCEAGLEQPFVEAYRLGRELHRLRSNVGHVASMLSNNESELESVETRIRAAEAALISKETSTEDRVLLLADLKRLSEDKGEIAARIEGLVAELATAETELRLYENELASNGY